MALQSLILPILSVFRSAGLQQASGVLRQMTGNFDSLAGKIGLAAGSFSAFSALTTAREFTTQSVQATQLFERNLLALNQVFEELQPRLVNFTKEVENYGLSQSQAAQASVFLGSVLKQYGFSVGESAAQTERLVTLAQDLATTYGYDVQEALLAITALFRGEYDPIEKFGVAMKQNEINARLAAQGLDDLEGAALANAQATARLEMLFERAGDSVGAFARATDTLYGSQQRLNAIVGNLQVAFGAPLQKPLAAVNNLFAELVQDYGPDIVEISNALAGALSAITPTIKQLSIAGLELLSLLQQLINLITFVTDLPLKALNIGLQGINGFLGIFNSLIDAGTALLQNWGMALNKATTREMQKFLQDNSYIKDGLEELGLTFEYTGENSIESYIRRINELADAIRAANGDIDSFDGGAKAASSAARRAGYEARDSRDSFAELDLALRGAATGALDAEGKLQGFAGVFQRIDEAIDQNKAKQKLEDLGFSAGFIEEVLTRPNWKEIFGAIAEYARLAAIEIGGLFDKFDALMFQEIEKSKQKQLDIINEGFKNTKVSSSTKTAAKNSVKDFYDGLNDEIAKQAARQKLTALKASEGLIEAILGAEGWEKIFKQIEKGTISLKKLQDQFNSTAAGVRELQAAQDDYERDKAAYDEAVRRIDEQLQRDLEGIRERAAAAKLAVSDLLEGFTILPTLERTIGRFEAQVTSMLASIESSLRSAFRNKDILEAGYRELQKYVQAELGELQKLGRQRDELAERYNLAEGLIDTYKRAFTAAFSLTSLFGRLKDETEKRTVTVVSSGIVRLGASLREFGVTITKSFEEPVAKLQNKSEALVSEFRTMAEKARGFAENLRKLKQLGLDPMLFDELVQAGVIAGGETAQALVDGGSETINEINDLFKEINSLSAGLGEEAAAELYSTGIDMVDGLLAGIRSKQQELEDQARTLAEAFNKAFQSKFDIQVGIAQSAAEAAANAAAEAEKAKLTIPVPPPNPALAQLDAMIANANEFIDATKNATNAMGAIAKREIFEDLRAAIASGAAIDISGIQAGMSSAELVKAVGQQAPNVVNNAFYIQPGNRAMQNATVESLKAFINQNGNLVGYGIQ